MIYEFECRKGHVTEASVPTESAPARRLRYVRLVTVAAPEAGQSDRASSPDRATTAMNRGALRHNTKVDVVAIGCRYFRDAMAIDHEKAEKAHREALRDKEFREYEEPVLGRAGRHVNRFVNSTPSALRRANRMAH